MSVCVFLLSGFFFLAFANMLSSRCRRNSEKRDNDSDGFDQKR